MQHQRGITNILLAIFALVAILSAVFYLDQRESPAPSPIPLATPSPISTPDPERNATSAPSPSPTLHPSPNTRNSPFSPPSPASKTPNPTTTPTTISNGTEDAEGKFCGGIAANLPENQCPEGYTCKLDGNYPDAGGKCVKN